MIFGESNSLDQKKCNENDVDLEIPFEQMNIQNQYKENPKNFEDQHDKE